MTAVCLVCGEGFEDKRKEVSCAKAECEALYHKECWVSIKRCSRMGCGSEKYIEQIGSTAIFRVPDTSIAKMEEKIKSDPVNIAINTFWTLAIMGFDLTANVLDFCKNLVTYPFIGLLPDSWVTKLTDNSYFWHGYANRAACFVEAFIIYHVFDIFILSMMFLFGLAPGCNFQIVTAVIGYLLISINLLIGINPFLKDPKPLLTFSTYEYIGPYFNEYYGNVVKYRIAESRKALPNFSSTSTTKEDSDGTP